MPKGKLQHVIDHYRAQLAAREKQAEQALEHFYVHTLNNIQPALDKLYNEIADAMGNGEKIPLPWLYQAQRLENIKRLIETQISHFSKMARMTVGQLQRWAVQAGEMAARDLLHATVPQGVKWAFGVADPQAIANLVGATQKGSPLADLFEGFGREAADGASKALVNGLILGDNPRKVASSVKQALDVSRNRALTISRTEMLRSYRDANLETYQANSDVVGKWRWTASMSGRTCAMCLSMDGQEFDLDEPFESHVNCFPAGTIVSGPQVVGSTTRWYSGEIVDIELASGNFLSVTPNHPILTSNGWVIAGELNEGGDVISHDRRQGGHSSSVPNPNDYQVESPIEQVAATFGEGSAMCSRPMPTSTKDFHGDGTGSQIHIVRTHRHLWNGFNTAAMQPLFQQQFCWRCTQLLMLSRLRSALLPLNRVFSSLSGLMGGMGVSLPFLSGATLYEQLIGCGLSSSLYPGFFQPATNGSAVNAQRFSDSILGFTCQVSRNNLVFGQSRGVRCANLGSLDGLSLPLCPEQSAFFQCGDETTLTGVKMLGSIFCTLSGNIRLDSILNINRRSFSGHVYNLQTTEHWYIANNIITHNCRCAPLPVTKSWDDILGPLGIDTSGIDETSIEVQDGSDWFAQQSEVTQLQILGPSKLAAYKDGSLQLSDLVHHGYDPDWGGYRREKSLKEVLGAKQAQQYYANAR